MTKSLPLQKGQTLSNFELMAIFKCANMGGMRYSKRCNTLVIICDHTKNLYDDVWKGNTLHYTGMGKIGNQKINRANKILAESNSNGVEIHLFEVYTPRQYCYCGQVKLSESPYQTIQNDEQGTPRKVWIFPLIIL